MPEILWALLVVGIIFIVLLRFMILRQRKLEAQVAERRAQAARRRAVREAAARAEREIETRPSSEV